MGEGLAIKHTPTLDEPWTTLQVCIRTSKGYYWKSAPAIKYTRDYTLCEPEELVWPDEEALLAERKYNTWWKNTYHKTVDGITFTIRFWDPRKDSDGNYYVDVVIDQDWYKLAIASNYTNKFYIMDTTLILKVTLLMKLMVLHCHEEVIFIRNAPNMAR